MQEASSAAVGRGPPPALPAEGVPSASIIVATARTPPLRAELQDAPTPGALQLSVSTRTAGLAGRLRDTELAGTAPATLEMSAKSRPQLRLSGYSVTQPQPQAAATAAGSALLGGAHLTAGAAEASSVVAWADGVQLHLSPSSSTGYECVFKKGTGFVCDSRRFPMGKRDANGRPKSQQFATAQEAAVAYARRVAAACSDQHHQAGSNAEPDGEVGVVANGSEAGLTITAQANGIQLYLSQTSNSGYECVFKKGSGFVINSRRFPESRKDANGRPKLQKFASAHEAAVAYARRVAAACSDQQQQSGSDAESESDEEVGVVPNGSEMGPAVGPINTIARADGIQLYLSQTSSSGYECVFKKGSGFVISSRRFPESRREANGVSQPQKFASAQEAAVAYARRVAAACAEQQQQQPESDAESDGEMSDVPSCNEVKPTTTAFHASPCAHA